MIVQHSFKKAYAESLADDVRNGRNLDLYSQENFPYDPDQVVIIPTLRYPEELKNKMIPTPQGDFESAVALYEAYPKLTPIQASDKAFWTYLTHVDLFEYVQARFPKVLEADFDDKQQYIINHWFAPKDWSCRHPLASLWWFVYQTIDEKSEDRYRYTKIIFRDYGFRTNFAKYSIARHKEAVIGYFDFLIQNPEIMNQSLKARNRFITKYLNKLGGTRLLSTLPRSFFTEELNKLKPQILAVTGTVKDDEDVDFE